ncbi:alkaline phosphatase [Shewanella hanedai]|uniref:Alkaline phosphatase n=1 Tax=Shewanella hanedai TaxID=25 RepID=A0A553JUT2_SHEHA|nr:alkaline phosphatase [Shewanella hanedai]TRY16208.1 alkaline phosphatase [Shewanella hanedai]GGI67160.1 alkaline phosphatase [Shewanella hanedai]
MTLTRSLFSGLLLLSGSLFSLAQANSDSPSLTMMGTTPSVPKNIVIMIGDGMGPAYTSAYRYYKNNPDTEEVEQTVFDRLLVGSASTYPAKISGYVTDSAAAATALATGVKSYNGAVSVDTQKQPLTTIMEKAKQLGLATGVAVTSQINHATPAAFLTHNESRRNYDEIANSFLNTDTDVMLGGGQRYFPPKLLKKFEAKGYQHISDFAQLDTVTEPKVIGLFADIQLPWAINDKDAHKLSKMTSKALELLSQNQDGFVLLVEGSLIDWAGHNNDIVTAMAEMDEFANAIEVVEQYVRQHKDTLMVVTADHNTGGLSIGANGEYIWKTDIINGVSNSPDAIASLALADGDWQSQVNAKLGFELSPEEAIQLSLARMQGVEVMTTAIKKIIDLRSYTGWTTGGHTGVDVQVFTSGPASTLFNGYQDNTDIANKLMSLLPKKPKVASKPKAIAPATSKSAATKPAAAPSLEAQPLQIKPVVIKSEKSKSMATKAIATPELKEPSSDTVTLGKPI